MIGRITGAAVRAVLVAATIATPTLLLSGSSSGAPEFIMFVALVAGLFTFAEYNTVFPSFLEFRDAPPLNRLRFLAFSMIVVSLALIAKNGPFPTETTAFFATFGHVIGQALDFPYSPVRLFVLIVPADAPAALESNLRSAAGIAYAIGLMTVLVFLMVVRVNGWPTSKGSFNVWTNLPLFDPTTGGDVVDRLYSDARMNTILGVLLPFVIPAVIKLATPMMDPGALMDPHVLIWTVCAWAFLPSSMVMRGIAMARIAALIEDKRRRAYAVAEAEAVQAA